MAMDGANTNGDVVINARGPARANDLAYARRKIGSVQRLALGRVRAATVDLMIQADPAHDKHASVRAELHLDETVVRAHASGATLTEAVDLLEARLQQEMQRVADA